MSRVPRRVAILGGTGLLGVASAVAFRDAGAEVVVLARRAPDSDSKSKMLEGCELVAGDASDANALGEILDDADHVVYAVGTSLPAESNDDPRADVERSLPPILCLLEVLRTRPQVGLTYYSSGGTVYGEPVNLPVRETDPTDPMTSYGVTKLASEKYIGMYRTLHGLSARVLRDANAYGPFQASGRSQGAIAAFLAAARAERPIRVFGDGEVRRDYIHVEDVARATVQLLASDAKAMVFNVGTGVGHSINELIAIIQNVTGCAIDVEYLPSRSYDVQSLVLDVSRIREYFEWNPISIESGIADTWAGITDDR